MKTKKQKIDSPTFKTYELRIACLLADKGFKLVSHEEECPGRRSYTFNDRDDRQEIIMDHSKEFIRPLNALMVAVRELDKSTNSLKENQ